MIVPIGNRDSKKGWYHIMSFVSDLAKKGSLDVHLVSCTDANNEECYFLIVSSRKGFRQLTMQFKRNATVNIADYGQIIDSGFGDRPNKKKKKHIKDKYNIDVDELLNA